MSHLVPLRLSSSSAESVLLFDSSQRGNAWKHDLPLKAEFRLWRSTHTCGSVACRDTCSQGSKTSWTWSRGRNVRKALLADRDFRNSTSHTNSSATAYSLTAELSLESEEASRQERDSLVRAGSNGGLEGVTADEGEFVVVNFYHFTKLEDPHAEVERHCEFVYGRDIHGRIYINEQGINAQLSGPCTDACAYADWVKADKRFQDMLVQVASSPEGHAFPRLRLRYKRDLVQVAGGTSKLPLVNPDARAVPLSPSAWKQRLEQHEQDIQKLASSVRTSTECSSFEDSTSSEASSTETAGSSKVHERKSEAEKRGLSEKARRLLLLDVRNSYEWDVGHFKGAQRPPVDSFRNTQFGIAEEAPDDPLDGVDREATDVLMYCTGGIRCDVYSTMLRERGFKNLYTLEGGVANYLKQEGDAHWAGNLFVFDSRLAVPPGELCKDKAQTVQENGLPFARCRICGGQATEGRHRNCANTDCNALFLSCRVCAGTYKGCCCPECSEAPRLRPFMEQARQYDRLHTYREEGVVRNRSKPSRRALQRRRRRDRRHAEEAEARRLADGGADGEGNLGTSGQKMRVAAEVLGLRREIQEC